MKITEKIPLIWWENERTVEMELVERLAQEFKIPLLISTNIVTLIEEGNTIPFIARYRKEKTGSMDDQVLRAFEERLAYLHSLEKRREEISAAVGQLGKLTPALSQAIMAAGTLAELEDIYRPYRQKRKTRASVAREKGLEPLAERIFAQIDTEAQLKTLAVKFIDEQKDLPDEEAVLNGACDIIAEEIADHAVVRGKLRELLLAQGVLQCKGLTKEDSVYSGYYDYQEPVAKIPGHRILAINRGESEKYLRQWISVPQLKAMSILYTQFLKKDSVCRERILTTCNDAYERLLFPSVEREVQAMLKERAVESAIQVFSENLKNLLMQPPVKGHNTIGLDPAYRTGCKIAVVDDTGKVLDTTVIYPTPPQSRIEEAEKELCKRIRRYQVDLIAIGNGTASRESEQFVADCIRKNALPVHYVIVSEAGASVYSASKLAAEEFPDYDVSLRSAVSIARRLQDPLAELVKIEPKAVGVGQYQHDMRPKQLDHALGNVVEDCVNRVGVDINTASQSLLSYVAGINAGISHNIVAYRNEYGMFHDRREILKVKKLGKKAYEQCAGFLRVMESDNLLDHTGVHPEAYQAVEKMCRLLSLDLQTEKGCLEQRVQERGFAQLSQQIGIGELTLRDIVAELMQPGRDPRDELPKPILRTDVMTMADLREGMEMMGTVRNVIDFGAFVDIGVHEDGLVHISQICSRFIKHPSEVLKVGDVVKVRVIQVDSAKKRIGLSMKEL